ncbi:hypothetical protein AYI68_g7464 [Smittium mucronatum]|uniref:Uncharacterized protein n=1 Tax=Smittium mucronatum TaxID=133383 RepID=A0A1R0GNL7_9FUNG|nr:hypothetical protein AYI68_g7464 [Smittium mucronatum]
MNKEKLDFQEDQKDQEKQEDQKDQEKQEDRKGQDDQDDQKSLSEFRFPETLESKERRSVSYGIASSEDEYTYTSSSVGIENLSDLERNVTLIGLNNRPSVDSNENSRKYRWIVSFAGWLVPLNLLINGLVIADDFKLDSFDGKKKYSGRILYLYN